jgi:hypothetical protein
MGLKSKPGLPTCAFNHPRKTCLGEWLAELRCEHKFGFGFLLASKPAQRLNLIVENAMGGWHAMIDSVYIQDG